MRAEKPATSLSSLAIRSSSSRILRSEQDGIVWESDLVGLALGCWDPWVRWSGEEGGEDEWEGEDGSKSCWVDDLLIADEGGGW